MKIRLNIFPAFHNPARRAYRRNLCLKAPGIFLFFFAVGAFTSCNVWSRQVSEMETGGIPMNQYITGHFTPQKNPLFVSLGELGIPVKRKQYLRGDAARALLRLFTDFHKEHPTEPFWVQSSTRNFADQSRIWSNKWNGITRVNGKKLNISTPDPFQRGKVILLYSSMPGTSRHHWGTDFDLNVLTNSYYKTGKGKVLYNWLVQNGKRYGFCQPYTAGRSKGYMEERWHWSYRPVSSHLLKEWVALYERSPEAILPQGSFPGVDALRSLAHDYASGISQECL